MFMNISGIDLLDQHVGVAYANIKLRCSWISLVLIYLIKMQVRNVQKLDSDVHEYQWY